MTLPSRNAMKNVMMKWSRDGSVMGYLVLNGGLGVVFRTCANGGKRAYPCFPPPK